MQLSLNKRDYFILGKLLCQQKPDIASELSSQLQGETDLSKLKGYFEAFCAFKLINPSPISIEHRRLFIATILSIYNPHTRALSISLAHLIGMAKNNMPKIIQETKIHYRAYYDFREEVDQLVSKMRGGE